MAHTPAIFVNLPVTDLARSKAFYETLGYPVNPLFTDVNGAAIVIDEGHIHLMLLTREFFATFTSQPIGDPSAQVQVLNALALDSREAVDAMVATGIAAGGSAPTEPQDMGFMYSRQLADPDGNLFEFLWMDPATAEQGAPDLET